MARHAAPRDDLGRFDRSPNERGRKVQIKFSPSEITALATQAFDQELSGYVRARALARRVTAMSDGEMVTRLTAITAIQADILRSIEETGRAPADAGAVIARVSDELAHVVRLMQRRHPDAYRPSRSVQAPEQPAPGEERRTEFVSVRFTAGEEAELRTEATAARRPFSSYVRDRVMGYRVHAYTDRVLRGLLKKVGGLQKHWFNASGGEYADETMSILGQIGEAVSILGGTEDPA